jgi:adenine-specific DNA-methyltransferase
LPPKPRKTSTKKTVEALRHGADTRTNIPTAEYQSLVEQKDLAPVSVVYERRNRDLDPQLVWRGKDEQDWSDLVVHAPPLYIQEKVHPKVLIDDLMRRSLQHPSPSGRGDGGDGFVQPDLFGDFNGIAEEADRTAFYQHEQNWTNRLILGDSLQAMASLAEREGLRGKVQCIYIDPPYGIKFNSNFQWSTTSRDVKDGKAEHITREPEQVKAFRDTWRDGVHSYLTYLRDRLTVARDLLTESGSIFVQIGDENVHRVRALMDEVFGEDNFASLITYRTRSPLGSTGLPKASDYILWYHRSLRSAKLRSLYSRKTLRDDAYFDSVELSDGLRRKLDDEERLDARPLPHGSRPFSAQGMLSSGRTESCVFEFTAYGRRFFPGGNRSWRTTLSGMERLLKQGRLLPQKTALRVVQYLDDFPYKEGNNLWLETFGATDKTYVVQTSPDVIERCILMTTDPGDLVLDPTCGSGTTAYVAEQWGRRWITIDTSRVALALARARIMGARYPYYLLADSREGQMKEAEVSRRAYVEKPAYGNVRQGFVYERVPHITLKSIANNAEIDVIWEEWQPRVEDALRRLNAALRGHTKPFRVTTGGRAGKDVCFDAREGATFTMPSGEVVSAYGLVEWEVPREAPEDWPEAAKGPLADFWEARIGRQKEMDASIAARAEFEYLYDKPYTDNKKVRVAGPFTVESLSPHRVLGVDENDELIDKVAEPGIDYGERQSFTEMVLENLKVAGVQQAHKEDRITFTALERWPGRFVCAEGRYQEGDAERRAAIFIGPEFSTVTRVDLVEAAREAADAGFDVLIACAFSYDAHSTEFPNLGKVRVLKARMNADLHMAEDLKSTGKGNLFVIFGEPDIDILPVGDGKVQVKIKGVDVFDPSSGEVRSDSTDGIACWFIDTDYNQESFFVRHAYFLGANDPYNALKTTLKAEIDEEAWSTLHSDTSRPFDKPAGGRIAVKVINHLGDEVMKVFRVG